MLSTEKCIEAFFRAERPEASWYTYDGRRTKGPNIDAKEKGLWDYGWYKICEAFSEPPEGFRVFAERPIYYQVYESYDSRSSKRHWRIMAKTMERFFLDWIVGYKDPFIPLFGFHTSPWNPFMVETSYGEAIHYGNHFQWNKDLDGKRIYVIWRPLRQKPFQYAGPGYQTDWVFWNVEFYSDEALPDEEIFEIYTRKEKRMRTAAEIVAEIRTEAKALGFWREFKIASGRFPQTSGNLGKLRRLQRKVRALTGSDEELVQYILSGEKDEIQGA